MENNNKIRSFMTKLFIVILSISLFLFYITRKTGESYCVIVEEEKFFIGEFLKRHHAQFKGKKSNEWCIKKDQELDNGDGARTGRVRWMECQNWELCTWYGNY